MQQSTVKEFERNRSELPNQWSIRFGTLIGIPGIWKFTVG